MHNEALIPSGELNQLISNYLKIAWERQELYIFKINDVQYATSFQEMSAKIMGPLGTERNITISNEEREHNRDRRIYLPEWCLNVIRRLRDMSGSISLKSWIYLIEAGFSTNNPRMILTNQIKKSIRRTESMKID